MAVLAAAMMSCTMMTATAVTVSAEDSTDVYVYDYEQDEDKYVQEEGWVYVGTDTYYLMNNGEFKTGWLETKSDSRYYFDKTGKMCRSKWIKYKSGAKYYVGQNGKMYRCKWLTLDNGSKRYFKSNGRLATSCTLNIEGVKYTFNSKGVVTKIVPKQTVYIARTGNIYHNDSDCSGSTCYTTRLSQLKGKGFKACEHCVTLY